jgi:hypothetical protein
MVPASFVLVDGTLPRYSARAVPQAYQTEAIRGR